MKRTRASERGGTARKRRRAEGRHAILVLGMHRSGTSAFARVLGLCGATLPSHPLPADEHNETGYWEPESVVRLHDEFLSASGSMFDDVTALPPGWHESPLAAGYAERLEGVLEATYGAERLWVVKDPRLCRLLPLWRTVLHRMGTTPLAVLPVRNPLEVTASLARRDGFSLPKSLLLWLRHFLEAEAATRDLPRCFVEYEALLQDWRGTIARIAGELSIEWPRSLEAAAPEIEDFLDSARRHHAASTLDLASRPDVSPWVWKAYRWAAGAARGEDVSPSALDEIREAVAAADLLFPPLPTDWKQDRARLAELLSGIPRLASDLRDAQRQLNETSIEAAALRRDLVSREERIKALVLADSQQKVELEAAREELSSVEKRHRAALASVEAQRAAERQSDESRHQAQLEAARERAERIFEAERAERASAEARGREELEAAEARRRAELESAEARHRDEAASVLTRHQAELEASRAESREQVRQMRDQWLEARRELDSIRSSIAWRLVTPLRWLERQGAAIRRGLSHPMRRRRLRNPVRLWRQLRLLNRSGLFDANWYVAQNPDVAASRMDPLLHYLYFGAAEGRDPNAFFNTRWYLRRNPDVATSRLNPLLHYSLYGAAEGRDPGPAFHTSWYRDQNDDVTRKGLNPLAHFLAIGRSEGRPPRPPEPGVDGVDERTSARDDSARAYVAQVLASPKALDPAHRPFQQHEPTRCDVKAVAFYLPQFHPIPENDEWWGKGFTEWTNVSRGVPQFLGHYQPRFPGELGFYDLRLPEVQRRQVELARNYGIHGFCFHFYWFGGRRLLERPLEQFLAEPKLDISFCLCWANESWSRRWDGSESDVLITQAYSAADDQALIEEVSRAFSDRRYLRAGGRPVFVVYRVDLLPDARETAERWRQHCRRTGIGEILLAAVQSFGIADPRQYGFDIALEFPPHGPQELHVPISGDLKGANPGFTGRVFSYDALSEASQRRKAPPYPWIRTVCPSWDNTARRLERSTIYHDSSPRSYQEWLEVACGYAREHPIQGEKLVFINAWNEWGEGAYLEPDQRFGYAYLEATRSALQGWPQRSLAGARKRQILLVTHNTLNHGAQHIALHIARGLHRNLGYEVEIVDARLARAEGDAFHCPSGPLAPLFAETGRVHDFVDDYPTEQAQQQLLRKLRRDGVGLAICNTTVTGHVAATLKRHGYRVVSLVHELPSLVREFRLEGAQRAMAGSADTIVCASDLVREAFLESCPQARERTVTRHQGLYRLPETPAGDPATRSLLRTRLGLPSDALVVLGVGYADLRKGFDIFMRVAARLARADDRVVAVWLGCEWPVLRHWAEHDAERLGFANRLHLLPRIDDVSDYYAAADVFLLSSREDPFPSVVLEALAHGLPVVAFEGATGASELLPRGCGVSVPYGRDEAMAEAALGLLADPRRREELGEKGRALVTTEFDWRDYLHFLLEQLGEPHQKVSVVVPNYNYSRHLKSRLESIYAQPYPLYEVIVLDDASTDDSVALVERLRDERGWDLTLIKNETNSGSVFQQWLRGAEAARGDVLWIAEADDDADPDFLTTLLPRLDDPEVVLAYSQSRQIDEDGRLLAADYLDYVADIDRDRWSRSWQRDAHDELREALVVKNTIPNVSAVLCRRAPFLEVLRKNMDFIRDFRVAGDYATYVRLLAGGGKIAFVNRALTSHRRHSGSVTLKGFGVGLLREIARLQTEIFETVGATEEAASKADRYLTELYGQFGVSEDCTSWKEHPVLRDLAQHALYGRGMRGTSG